MLNQSFSPVSVACHCLQPLLLRHSFAYVPPEMQFQFLSWFRVKSESEPVLGLISLWVLLSYLVCSLHKVHSYGAGCASVTKSTAERITMKFGIVRATLKAFRQILLKYFECIHECTGLSFVMSLLLVRLLSASCEDTDFLFMSCYVA